MSHLANWQESYASWMIIPGVQESIDDVAERREEQAIKFLHKINAKAFDRNIFEELTYFMDYESFCLETGHLVPIQARRSSVGLKKAWTGTLVAGLSKCLFDVSYPDANYYREQQFRALLSALVLQHVQGTEGVHVRQYDALRLQFQERHRDLQWQRAFSTSGDFMITNEKFRKRQCNYLLVTVAEYTRTFTREEPLAKTVFNTAIQASTLGGFLALAATTGLSSTSLEDAIVRLDRSFQQLCKSSKDRSTAVFEIQEITRITLAFDLYKKALGAVQHNDNTKSAELALQAPQLLAIWILGRILKLLERDQIEGEVSPPVNAWKSVLAFIGHDPPSFGDYHYLYGLPDCASQVGRILKQETLPVLFLDNMRSSEKRIRGMIRNSKEPSLWWKAIEFLLIIGSWAEREHPRDYCVEADVIIDCLAEEHPENGVRQRLPLSRLSTYMVPSQESLPVLEELSALD